MENCLINDISYIVSPKCYNIHYHYDYEIFYVTDGKCEITVNGKIYSVKKGDVGIIGNLENHKTNIIEAPYKRYILMVNPKQFDKVIGNNQLIAMFKHRNENFCHVLSMADTNIRLLFEKLNYEKEHPNIFSDELSLMYLKEILIDILRTHESNFPKELNKIHETILAAQKYIDNNFHKNIKIDDITKIFFVNKYYFSHSFKEFTGLSPKQYLTKVRLNNSLNLLDNTELSVIQIAEQCGFSDTNSFIKIFKENFEMTPRRYRKKV